MQSTTRIVLLAALVPLVGLVLACGPIGPIPGGRLRGDVGPPDASDWSFASDVENAQLETRPDDPHSVNTWFVAIGPRLYVPTSMILGPKQPTERGWVKNVTESPDVRIRLGDRVFERRATRLPDGPEYDAARSALEAKYDRDPSERDPERVIWIYRLDPHGSTAAP